MVGNSPKPRIRLPTGRLCLAQTGIVCGMQKAGKHAKAAGGSPGAADFVVLVDEQDNEVGVAEKIAAHSDGGRLHRAFSIFVFDRRGYWLLQKRAPGKYHFPGLWTNTCCSHPRPGEKLEAAAHRRLREEMGFDCDLRELFCFTYRATHGNGLSEWEYDHVFEGTYEGGIKPARVEVDACEWFSPDSLAADVNANPHKYTPWFKLAMSQVMSRR